MSNLEKRARHRATQNPKQLKTADRMRRYPFLNWAVVVGAIGGLFLLRNLFSVWNTLEEYPGAPFWSVFFSTIGEDGEESGVLWMLVWIPVIAVGIALVLLVLHLVLGGAVRRKAEAQIAEEIGFLEHSQAADRRQWDEHLARERARQAAEDSGAFDPYAGGGAQPPHPGQQGSPGQQVYPGQPGQPGQAGQPGQR